VALSRNQRGHTMTANSCNSHIRMDIDFIRKYLPIIGPYGFTIYAVIMSHRNAKTGNCFPSYKTIARESKVDRSTVIRYVKLLKELQLIDPQWRFKEDGSHNSNQYNFQGTQKRVASQSVDNSAQSQGTEVSVPSGGGAKPLPVVAQSNHPGCTEPPELSEENIKEKRTTFTGDCAEPLKKQRTLEEIDFMPTEKQKTCSHPREMISHLPDTIRICYHCWGLLDENLKLIEEEKASQAQAA